jgi:class 3 adenylate cyclase
MAYSFFSDYQPPPLFPSGLIACYNVLFTTIPVLVIGIWDEDLSHAQVFAHPLIYQTGIQGKFLRYRDFTLFLALAICQTGIIAMTIAPSFSGIITKTGETECFILLGTLIFLAVVSAVLVQVSLQCSAVTWTYCGTVVISLIMLYLFVIIAGLMEWEDLEGVLEHLVGSWTCVMRLVLAPAAACIFGYAVLAYLRLFYPSISDFIAQNPLNQTEIQPWSRLSEYSSDLRRVYKSSARLEQVPELLVSQLHPISLRFSSPSVEKAYETEFSNQLMPLLRVVVAITIALLAAWMVYNVVTNTKTDTATSQSVMIAALLIVLVGSYLPGFRKYFKNVTLGVIFTVILVKFLTELLFNRIGGLSSALIPVVTFAILNVDFLSITALNLLALCLISLSLVLSMADCTIHVLYILIIIVLLVGIFVTCVALGYYTSHLNRLHFHLLNSVNAEAEHVRSILCCFLPEFVRDRVRRGTRYIAEEKGVVTVLFCDICDFDAICANSTPVELTAFLDDLFQKFDMACERNGVFKVETVGKTYMACAGLKETERNIPEELANTTHARRTIELAFHILRIAENYRLPSGTPVSVKIGINSGPVVAGVVGFHKPQFSLVGDTVNTASRMCSTLDSSNSIQISEATFNMIEDQRGIQFEPHMLTGVKGKGDMKAYRIKERTLSLGTETASETEESDRQIKQAERIRTTNITLETRVLRRMQTLRPIDTRKSVRIRCCGSPEERKFRLTILKDTLPVMRTGLISAFVVRILILMLRAVAYDQSSEAASDECLIAYSISAGCTGLLALASTRLHQYRGYSFIVFCICLLSTVLTMCDFVYRTDYHEDVITLVVMYDMMVLTCCSGLYYWWTVLGSVLSVVIWSAVTPLVDDIGLHYSNLIFIIGFSVVNIYASAAQEQQIRSHTSLEKYAEREIKETDELLSHLLPPHVYESLKQERNITESFSNVTILFADIVGFTSWSSNKTPVEVVTMLSELFTQFDKLCVGNEVYKVHTIGDCYVAMGYAGEGSQRDIRAECLNVLRQAFDMVNVINDINTQNGTSLNMRIGLHTGEVIAGITGSSVVRYDIYGPDVLIANKMESGGESGRVNVSDKTRGVMEGGNERFVFEFNKEIEAKAISRKHKSYFVTLQEGCMTQHLSTKSLNDEMSLAVKTKEETMIADDLEHITLPT